MENPNHPNHPSIPEGDQAPAAPDGFAPQWIGEHDPNNNNGWIKWDVPLGGEVDEPMVDPEVNEEVMDDDDWEDDVEWLMAPVTPPRATMTVSSTYKVGVIEDLSTHLGNLEYRHGVLMRNMEEVSDAEVADSIAIGEIHPKVATVREQVQVMESQVGQVVSRLKEIETGVQQVQTLQTALHETELQNQQLRTRVAEMESHVGILMSYMLWMEERLTVLEKRLPGPPLGPSSHFLSFLTLLIVMEIPNHPNDLNVPEGDQAPVAPDGFAPQWIGEHDPNNNNRWIEWDVPLGGEVDEPMVDPEVNEEGMDDDDFEDNVEWLMAPVTPPRATMTVSSTYEVGGPSIAVIEGPSFPFLAPGLPVPPTVIEDLGTRLGNLEYRHGVLLRKMEEVSDAEVADRQVVSRLKEIETIVQQVESRVDPHPSGQMAVQGQDVIVGLSQQVQTLQTAVDGGASYCFGEEAPRTTSRAPIVISLLFLPYWSRIFCVVTLNF
uniref:Uncharacterized protein n=1 Tax=Tanacetum cinerariifolium TaxID=118510 RepID=A0A699HUJ2_TANCI|nr:hypothetical protein [Tanacetum cinerariifolium]